MLTSNLLSRKLKTVLAPILEKIVTAITDGTTINLKGDRDIEWSWVASQIPQINSGVALDFGCGPSYMGLVAVRKGFSVIAVDIQTLKIPYVHKNFKFINGDVLDQFSNEQFDLVINSSTIEHVGLAGRYGESISRPDGDLEVMRRLYSLLKKGGLMLLTIPVGQDTVFYPLCRVYGRTRLPQLIDGYNIEKEEYWVKDRQNRWVLSRKQTALDFQAKWDSNEKVYALGLFVLRK
jgi:SAM-dependent methyltransferase